MKTRLMQVWMMLAAVIGVNNLSAQKQVNVRVFNQYEAPADKFGYHF